MTENISVVNTSAANTSAANASTSNLTAAEAPVGNATEGSGLAENQTESTNSTSISTKNATSTVGKNASELAPHRRWATKSNAHQEAGMSWQAITVFVIVVCVLVLLTLELFPPHVVMMGALVAAWNLNIVSTVVAISAFSNSSVITMASLFIVVKGVDRSKLVDFSARLCLGSRSSQQAALFRFCSIAIIGGSVIPSCPLVALLMPILRDWARSRDWAPSKFLIPLAYSCIMGGSLTLIGSTSNLMIDGLLSEASGESFGFFENARVGFVAAVCAFAYLLTLGRRLLPDHQGGMFRSLKERNDMITELQVPEDFHLAGTDIRKALVQLGVQEDALLKVFRKPARSLRRPSSGLLRSTSGVPLPARSLSTSALPRGQSAPGGLGEDEEEVPSPSAPWPGEGRRVRFSEHVVTMSPRTRGSARRPTLYEDRIGSFWGTQRRRAASEGEFVDDPESLWMLSDPSVREIFPVPDGEVLEGGDLLLLSLPQDKCLALSRQGIWRSAPKLSEGVPAEQDSPAEPPAMTAESHVHVREADILKLPGYQDEYVELVVSYTNPFVGHDLNGHSRRRFEKLYQVGILAVRHATGQDIIHLLTKIAGGHGDSQAGKAAAGQHLVQGGASLDTSECLRAGDTVLVLAGTTAHEQLSASRDFLAVTRVGLDADEKPINAYDYIPLVLFAAGLVITAAGTVSMVRVSMTLAIIFIVGGWVPATEVSECIDWNVLILICCSLGLAEAVKASGLSSKGAAMIMSTGAGKRGTVFWLFLLVMLISETVTTSAAAALGFPLALDLTEQLDLVSLKPLAMTVMLATATAYANPVASPPSLMVMGPGGYSFLDFIKVGLPMDVIYCCICCTLVPSVWPLVSVE